MTIVTTCIGELPEELREAAIKEQRERRRNGDIYSPFLSKECYKALKRELMLTIWPMESGFIFTMDGSREFGEVPDSSSITMVFFKSFSIPLTRPSSFFCLRTRSISFAQSDT